MGRFLQDPLTQLSGHLSLSHYNEKLFQKCVVNIF